MRIALLSLACSCGLITPIPLHAETATAGNPAPPPAISENSDSHEAPASNLTLTFVRPELFTDAAYRSAYGSPRERAAVMDDVRQHFTRLAHRLPPGYTLEVAVLDIDLAGQFEPWHMTGYDLRIVRDITWPRMTLRYTLRHGTEVVASGEQHLSDQSFQMGVNAYPSSDPLRYERAMLDRWFDDTIVRQLATHPARDNGHG
jgi:hypothetical protein